MEADCAGSDNIGMKNIELIHGQQLVENWKAKFGIIVKHDKRLG